MDLLPFFEWLEFSSALGHASKAYGGVYAIFQSLHLLSLGLLGGTMLVTDLRCFNLILKNTPIAVIAEQAHTWFRISLIVVLGTGVFMVAGVAVKCYTKPAFWVKMAALLTGVVYVFALKHPLLRRDGIQIEPWIMKCIAVTSITIWFTVAAAGRWIGFS